MVTGSVRRSYHRLILYDSEEALGIQRAFQLSFTDIIAIAKEIATITKLAVLLHWYHQNLTFEPAVGVCFSILRHAQSVWMGKEKRNEKTCRSNTIAD